MALDVHVRLSRRVLEEEQTAPLAELLRADRLLARLASSVKRNQRTVCRAGLQSASTFFGREKGTVRLTAASSAMKPAVLIARAVISLSPRSCVNKTLRGDSCFDCSHQRSDRGGEGGTGGGKGSTVAQRGIAFTRTSSWRSNWRSSKPILSSFEN